MASDETTMMIARRVVDAWTGEHGWGTVAELEGLIDAALTTERERAVASEAACSEMELRVVACGVAATHPDAELTARPPYSDRWGSQQLLYVRELRAERDTLRRERDVLRAERKAGWAALQRIESKLRRAGATLPIDGSKPVTIEGTLAHGMSIALCLVVTEIEVLAATDAAGAMGERDV